VPPKGFDKFREKIPALAGKKIVILPIYILCMIIAAFAAYLTFDSLPDLLLSSGMNIILLSFFPLFGVLIVGGVGFILVYQMWLWRDHLKAKYGPTSYQRIFLFGFGGVVWVITLGINQYIAFFKYAPAFWAASPLNILATPLDTLLGVAAPIVFNLKVIVAVILLVVGILMFVRALQVFGFDYMTVVYLYFPEESEIQENEIYSALRHPTYAGALIIGLGGTFFTLTVFSFVSFAIFLLGFYIHVHFVEEKELIQRFGDSYAEYRKKVPAFFVNPRKIGTLLGFLFKRKGA